MSEWPPSDPVLPKIGRKPIFPGCLSFIFLCLILILLAGLALGPIGPSNPPYSRFVQTSRTLELAMFSYANDHDSRWPAGKSSTEIFQKLVDGNYLTDPSCLFIKMPGKVEATEGQPLKPKNVCYDVTCPVDGSTPDGVPVVFTTGYRIHYVPGGAAVPVMKPFPDYYSGPFWSSPKPSRYLGLAVAYHDNGSKFLILQPPDTQHPDGVIPNVLPVDLNLKGKTYHQLTPDGLLP